MRRVLFAALVTFACVLLAVDLLEYGGVRDEKAALVTHAPASASTAAQLLTTARFTVPLSTLNNWSDVILARPLFDPSRRPSKQSVASTVLPRLAGIIVGPRRSSAIFATPGDTRAIIVSDGGHAGPYLIRAVSPAGVSVLGPSGPELLHPVYDRAAQQANTPGAPAPGASLLDLLRARVQNHGGPLPIFPHNQDSQR